MRTLRTYMENGSPGHAGRNPSGPSGGGAVAEEASGPGGGSPRSSAAQGQEPAQLSRLSPGHTMAGGKVAHTLRVLREAHEAILSQAQALR